MGVEQRFMQCMEVWGGNERADAGVAMSGLDAWVYCRPCRQSAAGGDVYYVSSCATGRVTRLLVADVSGHGQAVSEVAAQLRLLMRRFVNWIDQTGFVVSMNRRFTELAESGCFATALVTTYFAPANRLTVCNAGHPPPLVYRAEAGRWSFLDGDAARRRVTNLPLGIDDEGVQYEQFDVALSVGDLVLYYTDALIESRSADGEMLGREGLLALIGGLSVRDPPAVIRRLIEEISQRHPGNLVEDDVTMLLLRPTARGYRVPIGRRLLAPLRVLRGIVRSLGRAAEPMPLPEASIVSLGGAFVSPLNHPRHGGAQVSKESHG